MDWENLPYILKRDLQKNISVLTYIFLLPFIILFILLFYHQVIRGNYFYNLSEQNRLRFYTLNAPRGIIYDYQGNILADNRPSITLLYYPLKGTRSQEINMLTSLIPKLQKKLSYAIKSEKIIPLLEDIDRTELFKILSIKHRISNIFITTEFKRRYPYKENCAHIIGYLGEISHNEYQNLKNKGYLHTDLIGKAGIEKFYEEYLRGRHGALLMEVDAKGNPLRILKEIMPLSGNNLYLTIDANLQQVAREALVFYGKNGSIVGIDPRNGAIRILVSYKDFDPNIFISLKKEERKKILQDKNLPLFNRALQGLYPPGSTFKILTTIAALNENFITYNYRYTCMGSFTLGNKIFKCWEKKGHGNIDLTEAIKKSCNVYFINLGIKIDIDTIEKYIKIFNLDKKTEIDLPHEAESICPSRKWKKQKFKENWYDGDTASISIGQGYISFTPVQLALFAATVANKGIIYQPYIVEKVVDSHGNILYQHTPTKKAIIEVKPEIWDFIHKAMIEVVKGGTGIAANIPNLTIAGKTGTAQNPHGEDHALFICFGPIKENEPPTLALAIIVEHGGKGGAVAAPIARTIFEAHINKQYLQPKIIENYNAD